MTRDVVEQYVVSCWCGHHRATHYADTEGSGVCLAQCECRYFVDSRKPDEVARLPLVAPRPSPKKTEPW